MKKVSTTSIASPPTGMGAVGKAWDAVSVSFDRFCLMAGIEALGAPTFAQRHGYSPHLTLHANLAIIWPECLSRSFLLPKLSKTSRG